MVGFDEVSTGCCGTGLLEAAFLCSPKSYVCSDASKYVFWESIHPTEKTYYLIFQALLPVVNRVICDDRRPAPVSFPAFPMYYKPGAENMYKSLAGKKDAGIFISVKLWLHLFNLPDKDQNVIESSKSVDFSGFGRTGEQGLWKSHASEIELLGGRWEEDDKDDAETALREAKEEIGLDPSLVEVIAVLDP
ncbi:hypothetical protein MLD38_039917 [Melastoma candidum]|uniref:Uncharacterized protein n=1 Tax=Melastoma candidum TaxID=119954 RepID=A0ACB9L418_9MYRT|nr:hypothetical protein MLD38_039917 [Melastoma candidum]